MTRFQIFESAAAPESALQKQQILAFEEALAWLRGRGVAVERCDLAANSSALDENPAIQSLIENSGKTALPVILMNGMIKLVGRYPTRSEMSAWAGLQHPLFTFEDKGGTCSGPQCCG